jgi:hypothetical protein
LFDHNHRPEEVTMIVTTAGREHAERRAAQAAAARKHANQHRAFTRPGKHNRSSAKRAALKEW